MKLVYVAHKIRDPRGPYYVERNIRAAEEVAVALWRLGAAVICPGANTRHFDGAAGQNGFGDVDVWLKGDLEMVSRCDAVVLAPGWETSVGARGERDRARLLGIPVFEWPADGRDGPGEIKAFLADDEAAPSPAFRAAAYTACLQRACALARLALRGERDLNGAGPCQCRPQYCCVPCTTEMALHALEALDA